MSALGSKLQNMKIGTKIIVLIILCLTVSSAISVFVLDRLRTIDEIYTKMIDRDPAARAASLRINGDMMNVARITWRVFALDNDADKKIDFKAFEESAARVAAQMKRAYGLVGDPNLNKAELDKIRTQVDQLLELTPDIFKSHANGNVVSARQMAAEFAQIRAAASTDIFALIDILDKRIQKNGEETTSIVQVSVYESIVAIALVFVLSIALGYWIARASIANPLGKLTEEMGKLAKGDFTLQVSGTHRGDEIGAVAKTAEIFKQSGLDRIRLEAEGAAAREAAESERRENERRTAETAAIQAEVVEALGLGLEAVSQGDLTARIDQAFPPEYVKLQNDFNGAVERLKDAMASVVQNVDTIRSGSAEIAEASDDLSKRTEQQAASLEETAAALDQVTAMVKRTAEGSREASSTVATAREDAQASGAIVQDAISAMGEIEKSSVQIANIIGVIDEIAFQTNLLALNAGVEAARAGDAGRGFAVVAQEVRALAQRSAEAAKEIKALISASGEQVERGVSLVGDTGASLQRIVQQVSSIAKLVTEITAAAQEQATGLSEINTAVNSMDQMVQQNAAMVEQSTAACQSLNGQSGELFTLVSRFKVGEQSSGGPRRVENAVHASQARIASFAKPAARKPKAAPVSMDATARKLDEWQEF